MHHYGSKQSLRMAKISGHVQIECNYKHIRLDLGRLPDTIQGGRSNLQIFCFILYVF